MELPDMIYMSGFRLALAQALVFWNRETYFDELPEFVQNNLTYFSLIKN
jgi:hypothetical protein